MRCITWREWPCNAMRTSTACMRRCGRRSSVMVRPYAVLATDCCVSSWPCCVIGRAMMRAGFIVSRSCRWGKQFDKLGLTNGRKSLPQLLYAQVVKTVRRRRLVRVSHRVVFGTIEGVTQILSACGWQIQTAFIERLNLAIRHRVAAVGRRVTTLCEGEDGVRHQLVLFHAYHNFCLPHASVRVPLAAPVPTNGTGSATQWRLWTPAMTAGLTDHVWTLREVLLFRVPPWPQPARVCASRGSGQRSGEVAWAGAVCPQGRRRGGHQGSESPWEAIIVLSSRPFCPYDGRQMSLKHLPAA